MSKDLPAAYKESVMGHPGSWVQLCPLKIPNISRKSGPQIKAAPLLPVAGWVQSQLGCSRRTKWHFHHHLQKPSIYRALFHLRLSRCSCCALIINRNPEDDWKSCGLLRQAKAKSWCGQLEDFCNTACCSRAAIFNSLVV